MTRHAPTRQSTKTHEVIDKEMTRRERIDRPSVGAAVVHQSAQRNHKGNAP